MGTDGSSGPPSVDAERFEHRARQRVAELVPEADLEAMAVVFNLIRAGNRVVQDVEAEVHRPMGWRWAGFRTMFALWVMGPLEPRGLASLLGFTRASVSSVLNTLEAGGLVRRNRESPDRRVVTVLLTDRGERSVHEAFRRHNLRERAWVEVLAPQERALLASLLRRLVAHRPRVDE